MKLSTTIASMAVVLGVILAAGYANGEGAVPAEATKQTPTAQEKIDERETVRRAALAEQQKRKDAFERACNKPLRSEMDFDLCRAAYKRLELTK
jgi:hypothetical protein